MALLLQTAAVAVELQQQQRRQHALALVEVQVPLMVARVLVPCMPVLLELLLL